MKLTKGFLWSFINRVLEQYLNCFANDHLRTWVKWISWAEYCYNTSYQSATKMSRFEAVHYMSPPTLLSFLPGIAKSTTVDFNLRTWDKLICELAQLGMEKRHDLRHRELELEVGQTVHAKLQQYKQLSVDSKKTEPRTKTENGRHWKINKIVCFVLILGAKFSGKWERNRSLVLSSEFFASSTSSFRHLSFDATFMEDWFLWKINGSNQAIFVAPTPSNIPECRKAREFRKILKHMLRALGM